MSPDTHLGAARIVVQLDLGFGDAVSLAPDVFTYPTLLDEVPEPNLRAYPREATVAEKFEAMVKLATRNSRMKDFHDIWALSNAFAFDGPRLQSAVAACFERRRTAWPAEIPSPPTPAFYQSPDLEPRRASYLAAGAVLVRPPLGFGEIGERIIRFLGPVRESVMSQQLLEILMASRLSLDAHEADN